MEDVVRKRIIGAAVLVIIGVTLPFLLSRCMHGPMRNGQAMRVYEVKPTGDIEPVGRPVAGAATASTQRASQDTTPPARAADAAAPVVTPAPSASNGDDAPSVPPANTGAQAAPDTVESAGREHAADDASGLRKHVAAGSWVVQVASFSSEKDARALAQRLNDAYGVFYTSAQVNGDTWYRVRIGPFDSDAAAKNAAAELRAQGRDTLVVHVD